MSTEKHTSGHDANSAPFHDTVTFEPRDINVGTVVKQLIYLAVTILMALAICVPLLKFFTGMAAENDTPMAPVRAEMGVMNCNNPEAYPPEPRLQGVPCHESDPQQDLRDKLKADTEANERFAWVDKDRGVAQIPVKEAMKLLAEKGGSVAAGAAPAQEKKKP